jgi:medium-chain acyl-[acyl-carrier-protein] hydrolase
VTDLIFHSDYAVHTYETDAQGLARPGALLNFLQDAAGEHAGRLGLSVAALGERNMTWVLSRYHVLIHRYPAMGETLRVTTWPSDHHGRFALRDFEVAAGGTPVLSATSSWMILDIGKKQAVRVGEIVGPGRALERRAIDDPFASLPVLAARESEVRFRVETAHLDGNQHVNNAVYVQWALEGTPPDVLLTRRPMDIEVSYRAEALYGDEVLSTVQRIPAEGHGPAFLHQILNAATGAELARLRTKWA